MTTPKFANVLRHVLLSTTSVISFVIERHSHRTWVPSSEGYKGIPKRPGEKSLRANGDGSYTITTHR